MVEISTFYYSEKSRCSAAQSLELDSRGMGQLFQKYHFYLVRRRERKKEKQMVESMVGSSRLSTAKREFMAMWKRRPLWIVQLQ